MSQFSQENQSTLYDASYEHDSCGVGFVANINGIPSHQIVSDACRLLARMEHRGACGCEPETGDGAGILTGIPDDFIKHLAKEVGFSVDHEFIAAGNVFLPTDEAEREKCKNLFAQSVNRFGQKLLAWREVPIDPDRAGIGKTALRGMPVIAQVFVGSDDGVDQAEFERRLYLIRKTTSPSSQQVRTNS